VIGKKRSRISNHWHGPSPVTRLCFPCSTLARGVPPTPLIAPAAAALSPPPLHPPPSPRLASAFSRRARESEPLVFIWSGACASALRFKCASAAEHHNNHTRRCSSLFALQCATCTSASVCCSRKLQNTHMWCETAARRCGCTCNLLVRPRDTRSITQPARRHVTLSLTSTLPGAEASRRHTVATLPNMARAGTRAGQPSRTQSRGGSGCCRRRRAGST
jgi:hypothetical protein